MSWKEHLAMLVFRWLGEAQTSLEGIPIDEFFKGAKWVFDSDPTVEREIYRRCMMKGALLIAEYFTISGQGGLPLMFAANEDAPAFKPLVFIKTGEYGYNVVERPGHTTITAIQHLDALIDIIRDAVDPSVDAETRDREKAVYKAMELQLLMVQETLCPDHRWVASPTGKGQYCECCGTERDYGDS